MYIVMAWSKISNSYYCVTPYGFKTKSQARAVAKKWQCKTYIEKVS